MSELYHYTGRLGNGKFVTGTMQAASHASAIAQLKARRLFITSLEPTRNVGTRLRMAWRFSFRRRGACAVFVRSLGVLIGGGTPMRRALQTTINQCSDVHFAEALGAIASDVENGSGLSEAMARRPGEFPEHLVAMVRAGELGGVLDDVLARAAILLDREESLRKHVLNALAYPVFVSIVSFMLVAFLLVFTLPAFRSILEQLHGQLPLSTRALLVLSEAVRQRGTWVGLAVSTIMTTVLTFFVMENTDVRNVVQRQSLNLPMVGAIRSSINIAAFARTVGVLLRCGVIVTDAVRTAASVVENAAYRLFSRELERSLREGMPFVYAVESSKLFGPIFVQMVIVGEETGSLDDVLLQMAEYYEADARAAIISLTALLEPALILVLGVVVGTIVASILVPLYSAIGTIH